MVQSLITFSLGYMIGMQMTGNGPVLLCHCIKYFFEHVREEAPLYNQKDKKNWYIEVIGLKCLLGNSAHKVPIPFNSHTVLRRRS